MGQCLVCRGWDAQAVCADCVARFAPDQPRCRRCGLRVATATPMCGTCLAAPPPFDSCIVGCDYAFPWDRLIADFKFNARVELAAPLAQRLLDAIRRRAEPLPQWVLPVPLAPQRLAERGYNQAWELARRLARRLGCHADARLLERPLAGAHQVELALPQRIKNLRGAFVPNASRRISLQGQHVAVVDDVMTSGATLREAAAALRRAGAARVDAWVVARTPAPAD
jgi:ComF family protein